jgi:hypothetical protein
MQTLWLKLAITPVLMTGATLAVRRWGPVVGGWIIGLPLTSGPISLFLYLERGPAFAAHAAVSTLLGINGVTACVVTYAHAARRWNWPATTAASLAAFAAMTALLRPLDASPAQAFAGSALLAMAGLWLLPRERSVALGPAPWWDLPARVALALAMVIAITAMADWLGPVLSGLLSPFPVFTLVMAVFGHQQAGGRVATPYARGLLASLVGFAAFFLVVALWLERMGMMVFPLATAAALIVGAAAAWLANRLRG